MKKPAIIIVVVLLLVLAIGAAGLYYLKAFAAEKKTLLDAARTQARINELSSGCEAYRQATNYYPGQDYPDALGNGDERYSGSQWLARALFGLPKNSGAAQPIYCSYKSSDLIQDRDQPYVLSDRNEEFPSAICYYPSRLGRTGLQQFVEQDNAVHTSGRTGGSFLDLIRDPLHPSTPFNPDTFLLIAPGADRKYFTRDDCRNW